MGLSYHPPWDEVDPTPLTTGQTYVKAASGLMVPTDIATQAELDAGLALKRNTADAIGTSDLAANAVTAAKASTGTGSTNLTVGDDARFTGTALTLAGTAAAVKADWEYAYSAYRFVHRAFAFVGSATAGGTYCVNPAGGAALVGAGGSTVAAFYWNPTDYAAGSRTIKLKMRGFAITNAVSPGVTFTWHLYPVATWGGASGARDTVASVGTSVMSIALGTPGAGGPTTSETADVTAPAAGWYVLALVTSGSTAANSQTDYGCTLQMRQV